MASRLYPIILDAPILARVRPLNLYVCPRVPLPIAPSDPAALDSLKENELWVSQVSPSEVSAARSAERRSRQWVERIERQITNAQENIMKQEAHLPNANTQWRRHSYLSGEVTTNLAWLRWVSATLRDESCSSLRYKDDRKFRRLRNGGGRASQKMRC
jgi:hypothetical protein